MRGGVLKIILVRTFVVLVSLQWLWGLRRTLDLQSTLQWIPGDRKSSSSPKSVDKELQDFKFYIVPFPELTTDLAALVVRNETLRTRLDQRLGKLNEEEIEVWMHRSILNHMQRTLDPDEATVLLLPAYMHLAKHATRFRAFQTPSTERIMELLRPRIEPFKDKPVVFLSPTYNPSVARDTGIRPLLRSLRLDIPLKQLNSLGLERNTLWQDVDGPERIIPVPYCVHPPRKDRLLEALGQEYPARTGNFVFYVGDIRTNAVQWAGCDRQGLLGPLANRTDMFVHVFADSQKRISQSLYNEKMKQAEYCLIVCGDMPSSRSLASAIVAGCIPVRVGSRLRGKCNPPCQRKYGWIVTNLTHLPYEKIIDWESFPELDEAAFAEDAAATVDTFLASTKDESKSKWKEVMSEHALGFVYGWGDPLRSTNFGRAGEYVIDSLRRTIEDPFH